MKIYLNLLICLLSLSYGFAQVQIKVHYISQTSLEIPKDEKRDKFTEAFEEAMKRVQEYELTIDGAESTFKSIEKINNDLPKDGVRISFGAPNSNLYKNVQKEYYIKTTTHDGYLEKDNLDQFDWKLSREKDKILNYSVRKATTIDGEDQLTAWYAPELTFKTGPEEYWGLPGLILKLEIESNDKTKQKTYYLANVIETINSPEPLDIPSNGKMVSRKEIKDMNQNFRNNFKEMKSEGVDTSD